MLRQDALHLIQSILVPHESERHFLFGSSTEDEFLGLAVSLGPTPDQHQVLVLVEEATAGAWETYDAISARAHGEALLRVIGPVAPDHLDAIVRPLAAGCSIGPEGVDDAGTLGGLVTLANGDVALISNAHVLTPELDGKPGGVIVQPGEPDGGREAIADVTVALPLHNGMLDPVDAAAATLRRDVEYTTQPSDGEHLLRDPLTLDDDLLMDAQARQVFKEGRSTGHTIGTITAVDGRLTIPYRSRKVTLSNLVFIQGPSPTSLFTAPGDSGSVVYSTQAKRPVSLHVGSSGTGLSFGQPIGLVLDKLGATFRPSDHVE